MDTHEGFDELPRSVQIRRIRRLTEMALSAYDLKAVRIMPIQHFLNSTFRVDAYPRTNGAVSSDGMQCYALRVSAAFQNALLLRSELLWLQALNEQTELVVPEPVLARDGSLLATVSTPSVPEPRHSALFRWVEGRFHRASLKSADLEGVGKFMAILHQHAQHWTPPEGFIRKRWDIAGIQGAVLGIDPAKSRSQLSLQQLEVIDATAEQVQQAMDELGEGPDVFGLIHADLQQTNYLFHKDTVHAIDFDLCGHGYYIYDIAVTFSGLLNRPDFTAMRAAFLNGYQAVRPLPHGYKKNIEIFIVARLMGYTLWLAAQIGKPAFGPKAALRVTAQIAVLSDFLQRQTLF